MKTKIIASLFAVAATAFGISAPVQAASLSGGESFGTGGIKFLEATKVDFTFNESHGAHQSDVKIYEVFTDIGTGKKLLGNEVKTLFSEVKQSDDWDKNGWLGTCGNTVLVCNTSFVFEAGKEYTLGLESSSWGNWDGRVFSTTELNSAANGTPNLPINVSGTQQVVFNSFGAATEKDGTEYSEANQAQYQSGDPLADFVKIAFDDRGNNDDKDFQDVLLTAKASRFTSARTVPEPATLIGLGLTGVAFAFFRRQVRSID